MPRSPLALALVSLAVLLASPALAQPTPDHAGEAGPPDHAGAAAGGGGPPDHVAAAGPAGPDGAEPTASSGGPSDTTTAPADASDGSHEDSGDEPSREDRIPHAEPASATDETGADDVATGLSTTTTSSPDLADAGSSAAPGWSSAARLLGPSIVVGLLAFGLVARARLPEEAAHEPGEADPTTPAGEAADRDEAVDPDPPKPGPIGLLTLGQRALDRGDVEAAADWFHTATLADPDRQAAHFCLGLCLADLDRLHEAEDALREARRQQPGDLEAAYAHAQVLARQGRTETALHVLEGLADEMPGLADRLRSDGDWACLHGDPRWRAVADARGDPSTAGEPAGEPPV